MKLSCPRSHRLSFALRLASWGGALVVAVAYAELIPAKLWGLLPPEMTWVRVIFGPLVAFSVLPVSILLAMWFPKRYLLALCVMLAVYFAVGAGLILLESALHIP